jgi:hypothetical protein
MSPCVEIEIRTNDSILFKMKKSIWEGSLHLGHPSFKKRRGPVTAHPPLNPGLTPWNIDV